MSESSAVAYISTAGDAPAADVATAIRNGLAPDGGLYMPASWPQTRFADLANCRTLADTARQLLTPFFAAGDLHDELGAIVDESLALPLPLLDFELGRSWILELFHGPTGSFKDFSARFLAACMARMPWADGKTPIILQPTTGNSGYALAAAFHGRPGFRVVILLPQDRLSRLEARQLAALDHNIHTFVVDGGFDDCQRLMDLAMEDEFLATQLALIPGSNVSMGRLLPQMTYYAHAVVNIYRRSSTPVDIVVPTGTLDNALACILLRQLGLPIADVVLATNVAHTGWHQFPEELFQQRPGLAALARTMDIGETSSFGRLAWLFRDHDIRQSCIKAYSVSPDTIERTIADCKRQHKLTIDAHTACSIEVLHMRRAHGHFRPHLIAAIADPARDGQQLEPMLACNVAALTDTTADQACANHLQPMVNDFDVLCDRLLELGPAKSDPGLEDDPAWID